MEQVVLNTLEISSFRGNVLEILNVTKEDRGIYYCCAENGIWPGARRRIAIEVLFAPIITVPKAYLGQALQYDVDVECHVEAYPQPSIIWLKDGLNISNNQHYRSVIFFYNVYFFTTYAKPKL